MKVKFTVVALCMLLFANGLFAQNAIPPGTVLPARLNSSLHSRKNKPGEKITARIMQNIPLPTGKIPAGAKLFGEIVAATPATAGQPAEIRLRFNRLDFEHRSVAVNTHLRALASLMQVEDAQTPLTGPDRGTPWVWADRNLIGDQSAYGEGPVAHGTEIVGEALIDGVLAPARANPTGGCRGDVDGNNSPQAFWVFSSDACGVYGLDDVKIVRAGRTSPRGEITLASRSGSLNLRSGSGILLRVNTEDAH